MLFPSCKGLSLFALILFLLVIAIHSKKKPPKAKTRGRAAAVLSGADCNPHEAVYNETGKCHETGIQGECPEMMIFYADPDADGFGGCYCDEADCTENKFYLFWDPGNRCYPAYERGPCLEHEWLVESASGEGECQATPCGTDGEPSNQDHDPGDSDGENSDSNHAGEGESGPSEHLEKICACSHMENSHNGNASDSTEKEIPDHTEKSGAPSLRVYRNDVTCACKAFANEIAVETPTIDLHFVTVWFWALWGAFLFVALIIACVAVRSKFTKK